MNQNRVIKLSFIIVFVSFLLSTAISLLSLHFMAQNNQKELNKVLAAQIYDTISIELGEPTVVARTMKNDRFLIELLEKETELAEKEVTTAIQDYLYGIKEGLDYESAFLISDATRRYYTYNGIHKTIDPESNSNDRWYSDFLSSNEEYALDVDNDEVHQNAWTVFVDARIRSRNSRILGVCGVGFHMAKSQELFYELEKRYNVKINLIDENHLVKLDTDISKIENSYLEQIDLNKARGDEYSYQDFGRGRYSVSKYIESLGWYLVVTNNAAKAYGEYLGVIIVNVLLFGLVLGILGIETRKIMVRTNSLADASFKDENTGLLNRRAFEEAKAAYANARLPEDLVYLIADVNGLKTANDTLGHHAGDEMIKGAADCLKKVLAPYGRVYRIGGDEFAAILNLSPDQLFAVKEELDQTINSWSGEIIRELRISCGYASHREYPSESFSELSRIADEKMYDAKEEYYLTSGKDRRRR